MTAFSPEELAAAERQITEDRAAIARGVTLAKLDELADLLATRDDIPLADRVCVQAAMQVGVMTEESVDDWLAEFRALPPGPAT